MAMILNLNVGLLGHVDSGKTTLAKSLSEISSTACFDKHPQAQERGITIDLGFSSFKTSPPKHLDQYESIQFTLVDCPGHASLISTVIGGAQIIDLMILVVDATKGVQTQTAECMVIAEITQKKLIVVLNKIDQLKSKEQESKILKKMRATIDSLVFKGCSIVCASALSGNIDEVVTCLKESAFVPERNEKLPLILAVDHCFGIQGKGTILTGTVLQGSFQVGDDIEIPAIPAVKKVKSIQVFRQAVPKAVQGDRVGVCVTQFDPKLLERGLVCQPKLLSVTYAAIFDFARVRYFANTIDSRAKYHVSIGHETVIATIILFEGNQETFDMKTEFKFVESIEREDERKNIFVLVEFEKPIVISPDAWAVGSRLDLNQGKSCRMAFYGRIRKAFTSKTYKLEELSQLKVYKEKYREGLVERVSDSQTVIGKDMFKKSTDLSRFIGMFVQLSTGEEGTIESSFGQSGKFNVRLKEGILESTRQLFASKSKSHKESNSAEVKIKLHHKRFIFDPKKRMLQN